MRLNKRELSEKLGVSETSLTDWQRKGMPVLQHGSRGKPGVYDLATVAHWIRHSGFGIDLRGTGPRVELAKLEAQLNSEKQQVHASELAPEIERVHQMFRVANQALKSGEFEKVKSDMRRALRQVPKDLRFEVMLDFEVMDHLVARVGKVLRDEYQDGEEEEGNSEMTDEECDRMGIFWYQVAAGEMMLREDLAPARVLPDETQHASRGPENDQAV